MTRKWAFVGVGLLGGFLSYGVFWLAGSSSADAPRTAAHDANELHRLKAQVQALEASVASSERLAREARETAWATQSARQPVQPLPAPEQAAGTPPDTESSSEGPRAAAQAPSPGEMVARLDARFFSEAVDPAWSRDATRRAEQLGAQLPSGSRVMSLECRSSMCRLEMSHPSKDAFQGFVRAGLLGGANSWDGPFMAALTSDPGRPGDIEVVTYLARAGADLSPDGLGGP